MGGNFPGSPVVKTLLSNVGDIILSLIRHIRFHMPWSQRTKMQNRSNIVTKSIKTLKMVHIKQTNKQQRKHQWLPVKLTTESKLLIVADDPNPVASPSSVLL